MNGTGDDQFSHFDKSGNIYYSRNEQTLLSTYPSHGYDTETLHSSLELSNSRDQGHTNDVFLLLQPLVLSHPRNESVSCRLTRDFPSDAAVDVPYRSSLPSKRMPQFLMSSNNLPPPRGADYYPKAYTDSFRMDREDSFGMSSDSGFYGYSNTAPMTSTSFSDRTPPDGYGYDIPHPTLPSSFFSSSVPNTSQVYSKYSSYVNTSDTSRNPSLPFSSSHHSSLSSLSSTSLIGPSKVISVSNSNPHSIKTQWDVNAKDYQASIDKEKGTSDTSYRMNDEVPPVIIEPKSKRNGNRKKNGKNTDQTNMPLMIDIKCIQHDNRTTLMIRNIPNSFTQEILLRIVNGYVENRFDFFYLPIDFHTQCNLGYCYINMVDSSAAYDLYVNFHGKHWPNTPSQKTCQICYARIQGMEQMLEHSKDWAVMHLPEHFRPLFYKPSIEYLNGQQVVVMQKVSPDMTMKMR